MSSGLRLNAHARSSQHATVQTTARSCTAEEAGKQHSTAESAYVGREIIPYGFTGRAVGVAIRLLIKPGHKLIHSHTHIPLTRVAVPRATPTPRYRISISCLAALYLTKNKKSIERATSTKTTAEVLIEAGDT